MSKFNRDGEPFFFFPTCANAPAISNDTKCVKSRSLSKWLNWLVSLSVVFFLIMALILPTLWVPEAEIFCACVFILHRASLWLHRLRRRHRRFPPPGAVGPTGGKTGVWGLVVSEQLSMVLFEWFHPWQKKKTGVCVHYSLIVFGTVFHRIFFTLFLQENRCVACGLVVSELFKITILVFSLLAEKRQVCSCSFFSEQFYIVFFSLCSVTGRQVCGVGRFGTIFFIIDCPVFSLLSPCRTKRVWLSQNRNNFSFCILVFSLLSPRRTRGVWSFRKSEQFFILCSSVFILFVLAQKDR